MKIQRQYYKKSWYLTKSIHFVPKHMLLKNAYTKIMFSTVVTVILNNKLHIKSKNSFMHNNVQQV